MTNSRYVSMGALCLGMGTFLSGTSPWLPLGPMSSFGLSMLGGMALVVTATWATSVAVRRANRERVLLLGSSAFAAKLCEEVAGSGKRFRIVGVIDDAPTAERMTGSAPWVGTADQLTALVDRFQPTRIVLTMGDRRGRLPEQALLQARLRGVKIEDGVDFYERVSGKLPIEALRPSALILSGGFRRLGLNRPGFWRQCSRAMECLVALSALIVLSPVLALTAALIKLDSRGSVFFIQQRVGYGGVPFGLVKLRTMQVSQEARSEWVRDNAARVTRIGKWLRRFRIDELPQLLNVLRGEMSFVGPRPHPASNYRLFLEKIPYYHLRELVRPGITGWAQVRYGYANDLDEETEKMRFDIYYVKHRSFWLDMRILVKTVILLVVDRHSHQTPRLRKTTDAWPGAGRVVPLG